MDRPAASRRARALLETLLSAEQRAELRWFKGFRIVKGNETYWISLDRKVRAYNRKINFARGFCVAPVSHEWIPNADVAITFLAWLTADVRSFEFEAVALDGFFPDVPPADEDLPAFFAAVTRSWGRPATRDGRIRASRLFDRSRPTLPTVQEVLALRAPVAPEVQLRVAGEIRELRLALERQRLDRLLRAHGVEAPAVERAARMKVMAL